jgi:hypothetical protein
VERLTEYFKSQNYKRRKEIKQKNWEEVYELMFSCCFECSAKTLAWGDLDKWDYDFKQACECIQKRRKPVVLVDILS